MRFVSAKRKVVRLALFLSSLLLLTQLNTVAELAEASAGAKPATLLYNTDSGLALTSFNDPSRGGETLIGRSDKALNWQWSDDGNLIAFTRANEQGSIHLYDINLAGSNRRDIAGEIGNFAWSPVSTNLAYTTKAGVFVSDERGQKINQVLSGDFSLGSVFWSPDGSRLIAAQPINPDCFCDLSNDLYLVNADGLNPRKIGHISGRLYGFWPDGQQLVYAETVTSPLVVRLSGLQLALIKPDGSGKQLLPGTVGSDHRLLLSPGGDKILIGTGLSVNLPSGGWSVREVANPMASLKPLQLPGNPVIEAADWGFEPDQLIAIVRSDDKTTLEEINLPDLSRRYLLDIPPATNPPAIAPAFDFEVKVEPTGFIAVKVVGGPEFVVEAATNKMVFNHYGDWAPNGLICTTNLAFYQRWYQADATLSTGLSTGRSWLWGPTAFGVEDGFEAYKEAPYGKRQVQYFDKARMEINSPEGDRTQPFYVTNGLLPKELIGGYIQTGDNTFEPKAPAQVNVAGDPGGSISYANLAGVVTLRPGQNSAANRVGQGVITRIDRSGNLSQTSAMPGVKLARYVTQTGHNIPDVFLDYLQSLTQGWVSVMGLPLSEPYQTEIVLGGQPTQALIQVFERRVLTYTPSNPDPYKVEQGNVGRHYFEWRHGKAPGNLC